VNVLISQITVILQNANLDTSSQLAQINVLFSSFFAANPGSQSLIFSAQISGFYSVQSFYDVSYKVAYKWLYLGFNQFLVSTIDDDFIRFLW